jgi:hypothetical protein
MSRVFVGVGRGSAGGGDVFVEQNGERQLLTRTVRRAHEGYSWDQAGPRSTELARAMLWLVSGGEPPWALYRGFTSDVVAQLPVPVCQGECWRLSETEIQAWLHNVGWSTTRDDRSQRQAYPVESESRPRAVRGWKERAKSAATLFRKRVAA